MPGISPTSRVALGELDESEVIRRAQDGDDSAFEDLYRRHSRWVFSVALRIVGNAAEAEDITQDTFVQVWRYLPHYRRESGLRTWVHRICVNRCYRSRTPQAATRTEPLIQDPPSSEPGPATIVLHRAQVADIQETIVALPAAHGSALALRVFDDLSYKQVATTLGITVTAARSRIYRARLEIESAGLAKV